MQWSTHSRQKSAVASREPSGSGRPGGSLWEGCQEIVRATRSPGPTVNSEYVVRSSPWVSASVSSHTESGPATATVRSPTLCTQGTIRP